MHVKKLASLSFALALVYSISLPARAELLKNFKTDGSIETKSFGIDNETDRNGTADDHRSETRTRVMLGASFDLLDDVHSRILLRKNNRLQGQGGANGSENLNNVQSSIYVDNAYVKIDKVFKHVDLTVGRQFYGDGNDVNIYFGVLPDDMLNVIALDTFRADADLPLGLKLTAIGGKTAEGTAYSTTPPAPSDVNNDTDLWGGDLSTDKLLPKSNLGVAYYTKHTKKATAGLNGTDNNTLNSLSAKANGDLLLGLSYYGQFVQNFGRNAGSAAPPASDSNDGTAYLLGLAFGTEFGTKEGGMPLRAHGEYGRGSSDFQAIAPGKRFGIIWGEHTNAATAPSMLNGVNGAGLTNLKVFDFGGGLNCPMTALGLDVNWYRFMYDDGKNTGGKTSAGSELDIILSYKHSENVSFDVNLARFFVGDALQNAAPTPTNSVNRIGGDMKIKF